MSRILAGLRMHSKRYQPYWKALIAIAIVAGGGVAQAQIPPGGARYDAEAASGVSQTMDPGSRWGRGLELSEGGFALSNTPIKGDGFVVIQDASGTLIPGPPGPEVSTDHRMTLGFRGIWPTDSRSTDQPIARPLLDWRHSGTGLTTRGPGSAASDEDIEKIIHYTMRNDGIQLGLSYFQGLERGIDNSAESGATTNPDGIALEANYGRQFYPYGIGLSVGYVAADAFDNRVLPHTDAWTVGARFDVGGLLVSGEFRMASDPREDGKQLAESSWDETWNLGARYRWGRNDVSLGYVYGDNRTVPKAPGDDKYDAATLSYVRELDRGVKWSVNLLWADHSGETISDRDESGGTALSTAIRLSF
jgi:hypothetical protein